LILSNKPSGSNGLAISVRLDRLTLNPCIVGSNCFVEILKGACPVFEVHYRFWLVQIK